MSRPPPLSPFSPPTVRSPHSPRSPRSPNENGTYSPLPSPTIIYDGERPSPDRSRQHSLLLPPDVPALLRQKRKWWKREWGIPVPAACTSPRTVRMSLMVLSIALSAVQANGVYCWPV